MENRIWHKSYDKGVEASIDFEDFTVLDFLSRTISEHPHARALRFMNNTLTYKDLGLHIDKFAADFSSLGVE